MNIIIISHKVSFGGGQENVTKKVVEKCLKEGFKVRVLCLETDLKPRTNLKITKMYLPKKPASLSFPLFVLISSFLLLIYKRKNYLAYSCGISSLWKIDFIGVHFCMSAFKSLKVTREAYKTSLLRRINIKIDSEIHIALEKFVSKRFHGTFIPISQGLGRDIQEFLGVPIAQINVIPNGTTFPPVDFSVEEENSLIRNNKLVFIGGDWGRKGLALLIESLSFADKWTLNVVGEGNVEDYRQLAIERGVADRITFHGHQKNVTPFIKNSQFVILPSFYEGLPISLLEAISYGTPIIYTKINGSDELFGKYQPGLLIVGNTSDSIIEILKSKIHEKSWKLMHNEALKLAEEMDFEISLEKYICLFRDSIK